MEHKESPEQPYFGTNIKWLRKQKKLTLIEMSAKTGISKSALSDYETNKSTPGLDILQIFSSFFRTTLDDLLCKDLTKVFPTHIPNKGNEAYAWSNETLNEEKYRFHLKLLHQRLESAELQFQMLKQLLQSKESENKTLRINIKLLEERSLKAGTLLS